MSAAEADAYFTLLADVPRDALAMAALEIAATRVYPTWPTVGEIRLTAFELLGPSLAAVEAWQIARRLVRRLCYDPDRRICRSGKVYTAKEWNDAIFATSPPLVVRVIQCYGFRMLRETETCFAQFRDAYQSLLATEKRERTRPPLVAEFVAQKQEIARAQVMRLARKTEVSS